jgi:type IV fimbrial biogenesis protein FimT
MKGKRCQRGITLVETIATSAVLAVVIGTAAPMYQDVLARRAIEGTASQLAIDLQYIRSEAVARNEALRIGFETSASDSCYVIHTGAAGDCRCTSHSVAQCSGTAQEIKTVHLDANTRVRLSSNVGSMLFHPVRGTVSPTGSLLLSGPKGMEIRHVVNMMGRTRTCSPQGKVTGYAVC